MAKETLYTFVAGGALEQDVTFDVKCNCGGTAPIKPTKVNGYGFGKKGTAVKMVDQLESTCESCHAKIIAKVLEGDPGYMLIRKGDVESLHLPQGSTTKPVASLSKGEYSEIMGALKVQAAIAEKKQRKKKRP